MIKTYSEIFLILVLAIFSQSLYTQSFTKITSGPIVNDNGWCYGACWGDFNGDGYIDLFVVNNMTSDKNNLMYMNNGNGTFTKVTSGVVVTDGGSSYGCSGSDYDNDGDVDVFVSNYNENNFLYSNNGNGTFTKITSGAIVNDGGSSVGCSWGDYDNDGYLDLFVCNRTSNNFLYHNNGNGTFNKVTSGAIVNDGGNSGGCAWGDYNNDNYIDLFVANAGPAADFLYQNNGDGTFTKITNNPIVNDVLHSSGGSWGDYDNDGDLDLFVTGGVIGSSYNRLFRNDGNGNFTKITSDPIVSDNHWAGGSGWADFDNDGDIDMFTGGYDGNNMVYKNNGNGSFTKADTGIIVTDGNYKEGAAWGDYDNDGDIDLFTARNNYFGGNNTMYSNNGNSNKWINIRCVGMVSNKNGIGTKVFIRANINSTIIRQMQAVSSQTGGANSGQGSMNAEFGLGNASIIDSIIIKWPSGITDKYTNIPINQFVTAVEGQGLTPVVRINKNIPHEFYLYQNYPNPFNPVTKIKYDVKSEKSNVKSQIQLIIYNSLGQEIETLVNDILEAGVYEVEWDARNYPSGVYFYRLIVGDPSPGSRLRNGQEGQVFTETKRMVLIK